MNKILKYTLLTFGVIILTVIVINFFNPCLKYSGRASYAWGGEKQCAENGCKIKKIKEVNPKITQKVNINGQEVGIPSCTDCSYYWFMCVKK